MKATLWATPIALPTGFCFNCSAPADTTVVIQSEGGLAANAGHGHGAIVAALASAATAGAGYRVTYCPRCAKKALKKAPELLPPVIGLLLVAIGFGVITFLSTGVDRILPAVVALMGLAGSVAWWRYMRRPPEAGQTTRWRAFAVLNQGKDLLQRNRPFTRIEYSNPRVLEEIARLNPGVEVTRK